MIITLITYYQFVGYYFVYELIRKVNTFHEVIYISPSKKSDVSVHLAWFFMYPSSLKGYWIG